MDKIDTQGMYKIYDSWPEIARKSFESHHEPVDFDNIDHIVFAGMGGSGAIGDMFSSVLSKTKIHVNVVKGYLLPTTVDSNSLVIAVSVSGNTAETLTVLDSAFKLKSKVIAFSSGGKMLEYCKKNNIEHRLVTKYHSPRASFTSYLYTMLKVVHSKLEIKQEDILESITELEKIGKKISSTNLTENNPAINIAKEITGIPMIYYPFGLQSAAVRFKNVLQENAKIHATAEDVLEACHNGIVSWEKESNVKPFLIQGKDDHPKTKERWNIIKEYFNQNKIIYSEITSVEGSILSKLINLVYILDYCSIYKAILTGTDPTPVKSIDFIKKRL
ncbi:SIS domain-containing protein [Nitrosopumilus sp.]|uniref:SIS domain-containing protein n=1 Tax=Nitrosopumilus sp. TaxID=2024843 RepID=UPI0034A09F29